MADTGLEIFNGFEIKYPEYEVITPQTVEKFTVRCLRADEEEKLKGSLLTPASFISHLNKCIYEILVKKPKHIKNFEDFKNSVTILDRDALLYGLTHISYPEDQIFETECTNCSFAISMKVDLAKTFNISPYPKGNSEILKNEINVELDHAKNVTAIVKQPVLNDEERITSDPLYNSDENKSLGLECLIVKEFKMYDASSDKTTIIKDRDNIFKGYKSLTSHDKKKILDTYNENFGKYRMTLNVKVNCPRCKEVNEGEINLVQNLFRVLYR